jgi:hypothetical protein
MDEILSEVRRIREQLVVEHKDDLHVLCEAMRSREATHQERVLDLAEHQQDQKIA